jgi:bifunctional DNA-binding transcriptional regulator/antitoxin component of YhaV-PrlF toxin-antitoxin module
MTDERPRIFTSKMVCGGKFTVPVEIREIWGLEVGAAIEFEMKKIVSPSIEAK